MASEETRDVGDGEVHADDAEDVSDAIDCVEATLMRSSSWGEEAKVATAAAVTVPCGASLLAPLLRRASRSWLSRRDLFCWRRA
jgi:hypothetical protein